MKKTFAGCKPAPDSVWPVRLAAGGGKMNGPGEAWAGVAELADAQDLGSCGVTRGGSSPPPRRNSLTVLSFSVQMLN